MKPRLPIIRNIKIAALQVKDTCAPLLIGISDKRSVISPPHPCRSIWLQLDLLGHAVSRLYVEIRRANFGQLILRSLLLMLLAPVDTHPTSILIYKTTADLFVGADTKVMDADTGTAYPSAVKIVSIP